MTANDQSNRLQSKTTASKRSKQSLDAAGMADALLKLETVQTLTGLSKSTIYAKMAEGKFVQAVRLSARCTRWPAGKVTAWLQSHGC